MNLHLIIRVLFALSLGLFAGWFSKEWQVGFVFFISSLVVLLLLNKSGRYVKNTKEGTLNLDERGAFIKYHAISFSFVSLVFSLAGINLYYGFMQQETIPRTILDAVLFFAVAVYFISDMIMRKRV